STTLADGGSAATAGLASNYSLAAGQTATAHITPAPLTLTSGDGSRHYGDANPAVATTLGGFVGNETLATSGVTGSGASATSATLLSPVGSYAITPTVGTLSAQNYAFRNFVDGNLVVTPRPLTVAADNVVRLTGEPDPNPFQFSTGQGGLVNGDALASVSIVSPAASASATGGNVLNLVPSLATFASGLASNYAISYVDGYLLVLPKPADLAKDNQGSSNEAFYLQLDPAQIKTVDDELHNQQAQILASQPSAAPSARDTADRPVARAQRSPEDMRRVAQQLTQTAQLDSAAVIATLRSAPLLLWQPSLPPQLLQLLGRNE
ncbi:MAG: hypothetical protein COW02_01415, partial [Comamonadaceae bacterium CG12_big_fil_rev_8_21_14_0_65_59_15]